MEGRQGIPGQSIICGQLCKGYEALGSTKRPLLKTFTLSLWSEEDAQNLQANKRE